MPIPRELFDQQLDPLDKQIIDVLDAERAHAFSIEDLAARIGLNTSDTFISLELLLRLAELVRRGLIVERLIHGTPYYASVKPPKV